MANSWVGSRQTGGEGWIQIVIHMPGNQPVDVTYFRDTPAQLQSFTSADPFGDATCVIQFPQIGLMDDPLSQDLGSWFGLFANVDLFWVPGFKSGSPPNPNRSGWTTTSMNAGTYKNWIDPYSEQTDMIAPATFTGTVSKSGTSTPNTLVDARVKLWEGFVTNIDFTGDQTTNSVSMECQGALFQADRYLMKPFYPPNPWPIETLIRTVFEHRHHPHLRTAPMYINWPANWALKIPTRGDTVTVGGVTYDNTAYPIEGRSNHQLWSGFATRDTGSWQRCLTGYIQDNLTLMLVPPNAGDNVTVKGSQWTVIQKRSAQGGYSPGRQPVLQVRDNNRTPDFHVWLNSPGVSATLTRDGTQMSNIIYGDGTAVDGVVWRNELVSTGGAFTDYSPLAWSREVYPYTHNRAFNKQGMVMESYTSFGTGINEPDAIRAAQQHLARELDPGYTGTITLAADVFDESNNLMSKWTIHAGMTVMVKGLEGRTDGIRFHIGQVECNVADNTVTLTVDTKYRDLLTIQEVRARTRDPLTPTRLLQTNKNSVVIEDRNAPWSYRRGSGFIGGSSVKKWWHSKPSSYQFPYNNWFTKHPPIHKGHPSDFYAVVHAGADNPNQRVTMVPVIMSERGTIRRTEIFCVDKRGNFVPVPFHFSLYYVNSVKAADLPRSATTPQQCDPYRNNGFVSIDPRTGLMIPDVNNRKTNDNNLIIMWGGQWNGILNRAGYYPGSEAAGNSPTGILVDDYQWSFDFTTGNNNYPKQPSTNKVGGKAGNHPKLDNITAYALIYADTTTLSASSGYQNEKVYFLGRFIRQEPGQG